MTRRGLSFGVREPSVLYAIISQVAHAQIVIGAPKVICLRDVPCYRTRLSWEKETRPDKLEFE